MGNGIRALRLLFCLCGSLVEVRLRLRRKVIGLLFGFGINVLPGFINIFRVFVRTTGYFVRKIRAVAEFVIDAVYEKSPPRLASV